MTPKERFIDSLMDEIIILDDPESMRDVAFFVQEVLRIEKESDIPEEEADNPWKYR